MYRCPDCSRHVWETERRCPFCAAPLRVVQGTAPSAISAAIIGLTLFACAGDDMSAETTAGTTSSTSSTSATGTDSMSSTTGASTSTTDSSSTSGTGSTSTSTSTSTSSGTSDSESTSSGTTGDTDTTSQTTTGGACDGRGEQICDGVCVNTDWDPEHCGKCFNVCPEGQTCYEGDCDVVIPPYGAPMPEPLWA